MPRLPHRGDGIVWLGNNEFPCSLYFKEGSEGIVLKIRLNEPSFLEPTISRVSRIPFLSGQLSSGFRFSLFNLNKTETAENLNTHSITCALQADYLVAGTANENGKEPCLDNLTYTMSDLIRWGTISAYLGRGYTELTLNTEIPSFELYQDGNFRIDYKVQGVLIPQNQGLLNDSIPLSQRGEIMISTSSPCCFLELNKAFKKIKDVIDIATLRCNSIETIVGSLSFDHRKSVGIDISHSLSFYGKGILGDRSKDSDINRDILETLRWISLPELLKHESFSAYIRKCEKLTPVVGPFLEILGNSSLLPERCFLDVVQALEAYHSRFVVNDLNEFNKRIDTLAEAARSEKKTQIRNTLASKNKRFITLESRLADLVYAENILRFDTGDYEWFELPSVIAHTRNYLIHFNENLKAKHEVIDKKNLPLYTYALLQILDTYILKELGFGIADESFAKIRSNRWNDISHTITELRESDDALKKLLNS